jgi:hypothetical protein
MRWNHGAWYRPITGRAFEDIDEHVFEANLVARTQWYFE